jgi:hypothetical protein
MFEPIHRGWETDWRTPVGRFEVIEELDRRGTSGLDSRGDAPQGKPVLTSVPPEPRIPLGDRFIRLSFGAIGIHGTNADEHLPLYDPWLHPHEPS